jgi:hypothetical protein
MKSDPVRYRRLMMPEKMKTLRADRLMELEALFMASACVVDERRDIMTFLGLHAGTDDRHTE